MQVAASLNNTQTGVSPFVATQRLDTVFSSLIQIDLEALST